MLRMTTTTSYWEERNCNYTGAPNKENVTIEKPIPLMQPLPAQMLPQFELSKRPSNYVKKEKGNNYQTLMKPIIRRATRLVQTLESAIKLLRVLMTGNGIFGSSSNVAIA